MQISSKSTNIPTIYQFTFTQQLQDLGLGHSRRDVLLWFFSSIAIHFFIMDEAAKIYQSSSIKFTHKSFICRNHLNTEINSLVIENANLTSLNLTTSLFSRIGLNNSSRSHISSLKKLQIVNTTLEHINICSPTKEEEDGENTNGGHHDLIDCQFLSGLNSLDLRDNNLKRLEEFKLDGLVELYLSGM